MLICLVCFLNIHASLRLGAVARCYRGDVPALSAVSTLRASSDGAAMLRQDFYLCKIGCWGGPSEVMCILRTRDLAIDGMEVSRAKLHDRN